MSWIIKSNTLTTEVENTDIRDMRGCGISIGNVHISILRYSFVQFKLYSMLQSELTHVHIPKYSYLAEMRHVVPASRWMKIYRRVFKCSLVFPFTLHYNWLIYRDFQPRTHQLGSCNGSSINARFEGLMWITMCCWHRSLTDGPSANFCPQERAVPLWVQGFAYECAAGRWVIAGRWI